MRTPALRVAARVELLSLLVLLANLATVHLKAVSSLVGPAHGCAYLFVAVATWRLRAADRGIRAVAFVPGVGGLLALRRLAAADGAHQGEGAHGAAGVSSP
ncbi:DUF3817 domain-containing protein [Actinacidiphila sp. bgisy145]|uniref:DUF3817 domain-containing protein n=1 Tax=Actinacidiphila sp. bgisy145 TaxID=3413792 RepID=UPI003EB8B90C